MPENDMSFIQEVSWHMSVLLNSVKGRWVKYGLFKPLNQTAQSNSGFCVFGMLFIICQIYVSVIQPNSIRQQ